MSILITGSSGQLGSALKELYPEAHALDYKQLDITDFKAVSKFDWKDIRTIINAAGYTRVDDAETFEAMPLTWQVNTLGVANLAAVARAKNLNFVHVSTEYVFDGTKTEAYQEDDSINPQGVYARSKAAGDLAASTVPNHYILRTSWVIGQGHNFVRTMLKLGSEKESVNVVNDQKGRPTFTMDLAKAIQHLLEIQASFGTYNFTNDGEVVSWFEFTKAIFELAKIDCAVKPTTTEEYAKNKQYFAPRPANSALNLAKIKATGLTVRNWREALIDYINQETNK